MVDGLLGKERREQKVIMLVIVDLKKQHHIKIHYESKSGEGTKVYFDMKAEALDEK